MSRLQWDQEGQKTYETGTKFGVLYTKSDSGSYDKGYAWDGLTAVTDSPGGADPTDLWADNQKYLSIRAAETRGGTIEAYKYPPEFGACDGTAEPVKGVRIGQQNRRPFGFCYRSEMGNDVLGLDYGYKIHIYYGCTASPSEKGYQTINDSPEAITFSWEFDTTPVNVTGYKPTAYLEIVSTDVGTEKMKALEDVLYGTEEVEPRLPLPDEIISMLKAA